MLLGQLYVYDKKLKDIQYPITSKSLQNIEILGLDRRHITEDISHEESKSLSAKVKNKFISDYEQVLKENNFNFAVNFWQNLTSFKKSKDLKTNPTTDFQQQLMNFKNLDLDQIREIISEAEINHTEEDFALLYGIKALFKLSNISDQNISKLSSELSKNSLGSDSSLIHSPEIIIISDKEYEALFVNINCIFIDSGDTLSHITNTVENYLNQNSTIKLVLAKKSYNLVDHLKKNLTNPHASLITSLDLGSESETGYFDKIVKDTLGIRLV